MGCVEWIKKHLGFYDTSSKIWQECFYNFFFFDKLIFWQQAINCIKFDTQKEERLVEKVKIYSLQIIDLCTNKTAEIKFIMSHKI